MTVRRGYIDTAAGQTHYWRWGVGERLVVALPPVPYSGRYFQPLAEQLALQSDDSNLTLLCPDPPGYGASDGFDHMPSIGDFAGVVGEVIEAGKPQTVEILGFHTGVLVAMALAVDGAAPVSRLHLIDAPAFGEVERAALSDKQAPIRKPPKTIAELEKAWDFNVARHKQQVTPERGIDLFMDDLAAGAHQPAGFIAAFACDAFALADRLTCDVRLVGTHGGLLGPTRELRARLERSHATLDYDEWLDVQGLVFDVHAKRVASWLRSTA